MAEIKIEKKKPVWPWILLAIIVLAVIAFVVFADDETDDYPDARDNQEEIGAEDDVMNGDTENSIGYEEGAGHQDSTDAIMVYNESVRDSNRLATDPTYTKTALLNLSRAVIDIASENGVNTSELNELIATNSQMDDAPQVSGQNSGTVVNDFKSVSENIVIVMDSIQNKNYPSLEKEVDDLKDTSGDITTAAINNQKTTLQAFFRKANTVLNKMNT